MKKSIIRISGVFAILALFATFSTENSKANTTAESMNISAFSEEGNGENPTGCKGPKVGLGADVHCSNANSNNCYDDFACSR